VAAVHDFAISVTDSLSDVFLREKKFHSKKLNVIFPAGIATT